MPDASPSWRSTFIQALVVLLVLALAWLKAVSTETIAGALMMVVTAIFMGQREARTLAAVQAANNSASTPRMMAMGGGGRHVPFATSVPAAGPNERVTVEMNETREPLPAHGRVTRQTTPGEIRAVDPRVDRVEGPGDTEYGGRRGTGRRGGGGFDDDSRRVGFDDFGAVFGTMRAWGDMLPMMGLVLFVVTCMLAWGAKIAMAGLLTR